MVDQYIYIHCVHKSPRWYHVCVGLLVLLISLTLSLPQEPFIEAVYCLNVLCGHPLRSGYREWGSMVQAC